MTTWEMMLQLAKAKVVRESVGERRCSSCNVMKTDADFDRRQNGQLRRTCRACASQQN